MQENKDVLILGGATLAGIVGFIVMLWLIVDVIWPRIT